MKEYLLFMRGGDARMAKLSEAESAAHMEQWGKYMGQLGQGGNLVGGNPLDRSGRIMTSSGSKEGMAMDTNGEAIGGWLHIKANDYDHAVKLAKDCPIFEMDGSLEVREVTPM